MRFIIRLLRCVRGTFALAEYQAVPTLLTDRETERALAEHQALGTERALAEHQALGLLSLALSQILRPEEWQARQNKASHS